jgi:hypothetical protein
MEFLGIQKSYLEESNHNINNLFVHTCIKMVPLGFEKSNQILNELIKFKEFYK